MKESTSQEIAKQQAQFQVFLEEWKEPIIQAVRHWGSICLPRHAGAGVVGKGQYFSESNFSSTPRSDAASGWTPTALQSSSSNQPSYPQGRGTTDRRIVETLRVMEAREEQRPSLYGQSSRVTSKWKFCYVKYTLSVKIYEEYRWLGLFDKVKTCLCLIA